MSLRQRFYSEEGYRDVEEIGKIISWQFVTASAISLPDEISRYVSHAVKVMRVFIFCFAILLKKTFLRWKLTKRSFKWQLVCAFLQHILLIKYFCFSLCFIKILSKFSVIIWFRLKSRLMITLVLKNIHKGNQWSWIDLLKVTFMRGAIEKIAHSFTIL